MHVATCCFLLLLAPAVNEKATYPRPDLLLEPAELARPETAAKFRILDARPRKQYDEGHVPGAVWVNHDAWSKAFAVGQDPDAWAGKIGELGIDGKTRVVIYDNAMMKDAARIWWMLRYWGVEDVRL